MLNIVFMGTPDFSVPILEALNEVYNVSLVVTQPDKLVGRKQELKYSPVKECALKLGIEVFQPEKIRKDYQAILDKKPDLIVTAAYGQIIGQKVLECAKYKAINVHGSLLPKYRGGAPIQRAIMNGDKETGITIMYMAKGMDSGDILAMRKEPIMENDTAGDLFNRLSLVGRDLLMETIPSLIKGEIIPLKQDEEQVTYAYNINKEEEELNLSNDATSVVNIIRGLNPNPLAHIYLGNEKTPENKLKIARATVSELSTNQNPGTIIDIKKKYFTIACGNNTAIDIHEVIPFGKRLMKASDFINGGLKKYL